MLQERLLYNHHLPFTVNKNNMNDPKKEVFSTVNYCTPITKYIFRLPPCAKSFKSWDLFHLFFPL